MKRILVLPGGGCKGKIVSSACLALERRLNKPIAKTFDLIVGTSVGAILGSMYAVGNYSAFLVDGLMDKVIPRMFKRRMWPALPKYRRKAFIDAWNSNIGNGVLMSECSTKYMCTAVNICDGLTHYFKSWEPEDGRLRLLDAVIRSFAAPVYFGEVDDAETQSVWLDGGTGNANYPLSQAVVEAVRQGWMANEAVHVLSVGAGFFRRTVPFEKASRYRWLKQALYFAQPQDGGLARCQMVDAQVAQVSAISGSLKNFSFQHVDTEITKEMDCMDGVKHLLAYQGAGRSMGLTISLQHLKG